MLASITENGQKYINEKIGTLLNTALIELISMAKENGDFTKFEKANELKEESEYHFIKKEKEPNSGMLKSDLEDKFDATTEFMDLLCRLKDKQRKNRRHESEKKIPDQKYLQKKRKAVFSNPADVLEQDSFVPPKYEKSESERVKIKNALMTNMLTTKLSDEDINILIGAMQKKTFNKDDVLIQYGDEGKEYFVLDWGVLECKVYDEETKEIAVTKSITEGSAFGELALLYQTPRSATISALTECTTWVLDQMTFKTVIMSSAIKERNIRLNFVDNIKVFEKMSRYEKIKLLDGLQVQYFEAGDVIVQEGDIGEYFYIIEDGNVECIKEEGKEVIRELNPGDYFGELALIEQLQKRTLTVKAKQDCKLLVLNREIFYRVLGSFTNYLKKDYKI